MCDDEAVSPTFEVLNTIEEEKDDHSDVSRPLDGMYMQNMPASDISPM